MEVVKKDFDKLSQEEQDESTNFAELLAMVAKVSPSLKFVFYFTSKRYAR